MYLHLVNKTPLRMACKADGVQHSDYLEVINQDPSYLNRCYEAYVSVPVPSGNSGKPIKLKASSAKGKVKVITREVVKQPKLTDAQVQRKLDLKPDVAWERLIEACFWQMEELLTPRQACKKAKIKYSVYLEFKELDVHHNGESFRDMASEAEGVRNTLHLAKLERERRNN